MVNKLILEETKYCFLSFLLIKEGIPKYFPLSRTLVTPKNEEIGFRRLCGVLPLKK